MISKTSEKLIIEGPVLDGETARPRRIEIDQENGIIQAVDEPRGEGDLVLGSSAVILPGCIDIHVHAREDVSGEQNYKETFQSAGEAALHGGVVGFVEMPNNKVPPIDDASYAAKRALAESSAVEILLYAGVGPRTRPLSLNVPYKVYMGPSVGDLFFRDDPELREVMVHYRDKWVSFHAESPEILERARNAPTHWEKRPPEAEVAAIELIVELVKEHGIHANVCHLTTEAGLQTILRARAQGYSVTCEATPHHLAFDLDMLDSLPRAGMLQCNPPLRSRRDRHALLEAFQAGEIDYLATDHAPHTLEENEAGVSGMPHLDTFGPFLFWLREQGTPWSVLHRAACENPGRFFGRFARDRYGRIEPGFAGSLTVLDTAKETTVRRGRLRSKARWSPFEGTKFTGSVTHTIVRGEVHPAPPDS